ncbi:hypothetical protein TNCV_2185381 [Trichonephila clavipes]|nr:hypothetical protein TNCV_2185381 [Trichonephila clavipes]
MKRLEWKIASSSERRSTEATRPGFHRQPIAVMPPSRMQNTTLAMPLIEDLSRYGIEDCSYSPEAQKSNDYSIRTMK